MRKEQYFIWIDLRKVGRREREDKKTALVFTSRSTKWEQSRKYKKMQMKIKDSKKNLFMLKIIVFDVPKKTVLNIFLLKLLFLAKNGSSAQEIPTSKNICFLKLRKVSCVLKAEKSNLYENDAIYC